jgi:hypothetical protein
MSDQAQPLTTHGDLINVLSRILERAMKDVAFGLRFGLLRPKSLTVANHWCPSPSHGGKLPSSAECLQAVTFLRGADAAMVCDLVNALIGRAVISPDFLIRRARRMAANPSHLESDRMVIAMRRDARNERDAVRYREHWQAKGAAITQQQRRERISLSLCS